MFATTDASGTLTNTYQTGPFGETISSQTTPNNTTNGSSLGYVGQHEKFTEMNYAAQPVQMGARAYIPGLGRFLQVDPVQGGGDNNYSYPTDPVNDFDLDGTMWSLKSALKVTTRIATVGSFIPGPIGIVCSGVAVAGNLAQHNYAAAAASSIGLLGGIGGAAALAGKLAGNVKIGAGVGQALSKAGSAFNDSKAVQKIVGAQKDLPVVGKNSALFGTGRNSFANNLGKRIKLSGSLKTLRIGWSKEGGNATFRLLTSMSHASIWVIKTGRRFR